MKSVSNPLTIIALFAALPAILFDATCTASSTEKITAAEAKNRNAAANRLEFS
jgi:hypothetical protein